MFQVRIHGRGGQGVVTAAELLSVAAFAEGPTRAGVSDVRVGADRARRSSRSAASTTADPGCASRSSSRTP